MTTGRLFHHLENEYKEHLVAECAEERRVKLRPPPRNSHWLGELCDQLFVFLVTLSVPDNRGVSDRYPVR
jgi:hypothetical protein